MRLDCAPETAACDDVSSVPEWLDVVGVAVLLLVVVVPLLLLARERRRARSAAPPEGELPR